MKRIIIIFMTSIMLIISGCSSSNKYVLMVKDGHPNEYPDSTYGESFDKFFGSPTWKYFKGDGSEDVVEFSGDCTYQNVKVKANMQFILDTEAGTFDAGALSFNEVPQNQLITIGLLSKVFEDSTPSSTTSSDTVDSNTSSDTVDSNTISKIDLFTYMGKSKSEMIKTFGDPISSDGAQAGYIYNYTGYNFFIVDDKIVGIEVTGSNLMINGIKVGMLPKDIKAHNGNPTSENKDSSGYVMDYRLQSDYYSIKFYSDDPNSPIKSIYAGELTYEN